jgi:transcription initiation factor TFIIIB Brf1 subunit/transcription initiation factor TFIIB
MTPCEHCGEKAAVKQTKAKDLVCRDCYLVAYDEDQDPDGAYEKDDPKHSRWLERKISQYEASKDE